MDKIKLSIQRKILLFSFLKTMPRTGMCTGMRLIKNHPIAYEI